MFKCFKKRDRLLQYILSEVHYNTHLLHIVLDKLRKLTPHTDPEISFFVEVDGNQQRTVHMNLKVSQSLPLTIVIADKAGNPAKVDGAPAWSVTDPSAASIAASADGMSAVLTPLGPLVDFQVQVNADADLGEGVKSILGSLDISMVAGDAASIAISAGTPSDI